MADKSFKDPVYGYISIPSDLVHTVIDAPAFQRLRRIIQTSYEPLFPSATHNRFVHSLGVYHLGRMVCQAIKEHSLEDLAQLTGETKPAYERYLEVFLSSCLLHDVGHAPFSHTGEEFFCSPGDPGSKYNLHNRIAALTDDSSFAEECKKNDDLAAPHELMSVIIGVNTFSTIFRTKGERKFFARAICGYPYASVNTNEDGIDTSFLNCLIRLLHSSTIDVDRLDYLIRDAASTGFKTIDVDYHRLIDGIRIRYSDNKCVQTFTKSAVCVLENVVYAHDSEKKWIQKHPVINYEMHLLHKAFSAINAKFASKSDEKTIFTEAALSEEGIVIPGTDNLRLRYLCDDDIIFLLKNIDNDSARRYLNRNTRYCPLWKSEAEFCALFGETDWDESYSHDDILRLRSMFEFLMTTLKKIGSAEINEDTLTAMESDALTAKNACGNSNEASSLFDRVSIYLQKDLLWKFMKAIRDFSTEMGIPFSFQIIEGKLFTSGFATDKLSKLHIELGEACNITELGKISSILSSRDHTLPEKTYYLFAERVPGDKFETSKILVNKLRNFIRSHQDDVDKIFSRKVPDPRHST